MPNGCATAFRVLYGRAPGQRRDSATYANSWPTQARKIRRWTALMRVLLASNEFLTLD